MPTSFRRPTALATKAKRGVGLGVEEAVAAAQRNLDGMRERILAEIDHQLALIRASAPGLEREDPAASEAVVAAADALTGLCATHDLLPIGEAARAVCKLADEVEGPLPGEAVKMLADTMVLLREQTDARRQAVWAELRAGVAAAVTAAAQKRLRRSASPPTTPTI